MSYEPCPILELMPEAMCSHPAAQSPDAAGALATALWLVDPMHNTWITAFMRVAHHADGALKDAQVIRLCAQGKTPAYAEIYWDHRGAHSYQAYRGECMQSINEADGDELRVVKVHLANLPAFLKEWGLPALDRDLVLRLVGNNSIERQEEWEEVGDLADADVARCDLSEGPFDNDDYLRVALSALASDALRMHLFKAEDYYRKHYLWRAVQDNELEAVRGLLEHGCPIDVKDEANNNQTPLHLAKYNPDISRILIERGANIHARTENGRTPLSVCCHGDVARQLIAAGADLYAEDEDGFTPLHWALRISGANSGKQGRGALQAIEALLQRCVSPHYVPSQPTEDYLTPFQMAVWRGYVKEVQYLADRCPIDFSQKTVARRSLMQLAAKHPEMKTLLRSLRTQSEIADTMDIPSGADDAPAKKKAFSPL